MEAVRIIVDVLVIIADAVLIVEILRRWKGRDGEK